MLISHNKTKHKKINDYKVIQKKLCSFHKFKERNRKKKQLPNNNQNSNLHLKSILELLPIVTSMNSSIAPT